MPILRVKKASAALEQFWVFMERNGTHLIALDGGSEGEDGGIKAAREFCELNELSTAADPFCSGPFVFVPVDPADKDLAAFYSWAETPPGTVPLREVWRPFLWVHSASGGAGGAAVSNTMDPWGVNKLLEAIQIAEGISIYTVLQTFLAANEPVAP